jgi:hypothetical protein
MNERIKQLAKQAGLDDDICPLDEWDNPELEKFAELIVAECIDVCNQQKKWVSDMTVFDAQDIAWNQARIQQSQHIVDKIQQHFDVAE